MKTVNIVGGGLAGLALGLALRKSKVPVSVFEAGDYPRHKVCGEFISGAGPRLLTGLGLESTLQACGMRMAREVRFFVDGVSSRVVDLPSPAWCVSRWTLDRVLAESFEEHGGHLVRQARQPVQCPPEGWVLASGRRRGTQARSHRVGVKFHLLGARLKADLEMHLENGSYVGLCAVEGDRVNVCALLPRRAVPEAVSRDPVGSLAGVFPTTLRDRLVDAEYVPETLASVAGLDYGSAQSTGEFLRLGDSQGLIPPITGNGMSLAFESAALALGPLRLWSLGQLGWGTACREIQLRLRSRFGGRLWRARHLQSFLLNPLWARLQSSLVPLYPVLVPLAFRGTR